MQVIQDYSLRCYVRDLYCTNADKRGGAQFRPLYKKDIKPFRSMVKQATNEIESVLNKVKYPYSNN